LIKSNTFRLFKRQKGQTVEEKDKRELWRKVILGAMGDKQNKTKLERIRVFF